MNTPYRYKLCLDDERQVAFVTKYLEEGQFDEDQNWILARSVQEAISIIRKFGLPYAMSLDHDMGTFVVKGREHYQEEDKSFLAPDGQDFCHWLVAYVNNSPVPLEKPLIRVHSMNYYGANQMRKILENAIWQTQGDNHG